MAEVLPSASVDAAIDWYVRLASGLQTDADQAAFARWHAADATHAEAWRRMQALGGTLARGAERVPSAVVHRVLDASATSQARRRLMKALAFGGVSGGSLWLLREPLALGRQWDATIADAATAVGERRMLRLPDGSRLRMNAATAVDIAFDAGRRHLRLRRGELEVAAIVDPSRPLQLDTDDGRLVTSGARFCVRCDAGRGTWLGVSEGSVEARPHAAAAATRVAAGQQLRFDRRAAAAVQVLDDNAIAWTQGLISANRMPLGEFVAELDRFHHGRLRCDPAVAGLRLTAVHRLDGPQSLAPILASLPRALPVRISRLTGYWITIEARSAHA